MIYTLKIVILNVNYPLIETKYLLSMFNFVKKVVAGPKKMMEYDGKDLDLTYISERLIAMAFPACTRLEKIYRNDINDVAQYLNIQHKGNYLIINVSNRLYDYSQF